MKLNAQTMVLNRVGHRSYVAAGITLLSEFVGSAEKFNDIPKTVAHRATRCSDVFRFK
tara:strand:+ start:348 stop:521 length:174 start_codon:yes stop_codon:yes gene_type:complete